LLSAPRFLLPIPRNTEADDFSAPLALKRRIVVAAYLYELAKAFSRFYHDCPILGAEEPDLAGARLALCKAVLVVLRNAMGLVCIPFLEAM